MISYTNILKSYMTNYFHHSYIANYFVVFSNKIYVPVSFKIVLTVC